MSAQWFNPLEDTAEGRLLKDVRELLKAVRKNEDEYENKLERLENKCRQAMKEGKDVDLEAIVSQITGDSSGRNEHHGMLMNDGREFLSSLSKSVRNKKKADLDKDGKLSGYEKKRAKAIERSMAREGYKSDRGQKPAPKLPTPKKGKTVIKGDASDNCPRCGANPHEECGMPGRSGEHQAINCTLNPIAFDSRMDDLREPESIMEHLDENHGNMKLPSKVRGILIRGDEEGSSVDDLQKYEKEPSSMNSVPRFQNVDGGIPVIARGFTTNQRIPHTEDGIKKKIVSEKANIPAYSQQGYAANSSSLHMHLTDGGNAGNIPNLAPIEERLASLTKGASKDNQGVIGEIEGLIKQVKDHLASN